MRNRAPTQPRSGLRVNMGSSAKMSPGASRPGLALVPSNPRKEKAPPRPGRRRGLPLKQGDLIETQSATTPTGPLEPSSTRYVETARARQHNS